MLTPDQHATRLEGMTATDIAAVLGQHPYRSAIDVWREKRGESEPYVDTERSKWGQLLEPVIRANYEQERSCRVIVPSTLRGIDGDEWMIATPDGLVFLPGNEAEPELGLEIKCHTTRLWHLYGDEGTDEVPPHELCQCLWGMAVTGLPRWDLVAFIDGLPRIYTVQRDDEIIGLMRDAAEKFLVDHVRSGTPPEPDGTEAYDAYLKAKWKTNGADLVDIGDNNEIFSLIEKGRDHREEIHAHEQALEKIVQQLKAFTGDRAGLTWKDAKGKPLRTSWKHSKESRRTDHEAVVGEMVTTAALAVSAKRPDIERALECLRTHVGWIGSSSRIGAMEGPAMHDLLTSLRDALDAIARNVTEAKHTSTFTTRPFLWPSQWNKGKAKENK